MIDRRVFDLSLGEIAVVGLLILVFFDVDQLPGLMRQAGRMYAKVRGASNELTRAFNSEVARAEADHRREQMERRRDATLREPREESNKLRQARANAPARPAPDDAVMRPRPGGPPPTPGFPAEPTSSGDPRVDPATPATAPPEPPGPPAPDPGDSGGDP